MDRRHTCGVRLTGKTIATRGLGHEARRPRSKPESILLPSFLRSSPAPLFCPGWRTGWGGPFPGAASFTAPDPKGSRARHKSSGHCHSPQSPAILKGTFESRMPPPLTPPHSAPPPADRDGPPRDTSRGRSRVWTSTVKAQLCPVNTFNPPPPILDLFLSFHQTATSS